MKWFPSLRPRRRLFLWTTLGLLLLTALAARADLSEWVRHLDYRDPLRSVFFRAVELPGGLTQVRRPPVEVRKALSERINRAPTKARLYMLRALEAENQLDFEAAEKDWWKYEEVAEDKLSARLDLADFYKRRLQPVGEISVLTMVAEQPAPQTERSLPPLAQTSSKAFERILAVAKDHALPPEVTAQTYQAWIKRHPKEPSLYGRFFGFLLEEKRFSEAEDIIENYRKNFPHLEAFPIKSRASLAAARGPVEDAITIYEETFQPLWPPEVAGAYFNLLKREGRLRGYLDRARAGVTEQPESLLAAARLFYYHQQQGNPAAAQQALAQLRLRKEAAGSEWQAEELRALAKLYGDLRNYNEAARYFYALYSLPTAKPEDREEALGGILDLLLSAPEQPFRIGAGDFTLYKDIATMDSYPGFLNGILSLLLNSEDPAQEYQRRERASVAYYHRARAAELLPLFDREFPGSKRRPALHARLIETYNTYGESEAVLRHGRAFLASFPNASQRLRMAMLMADAYARNDQTQEEFSLYEELLQELAAKAGNVPLGAGPPQSVWDSRAGKPEQNRYAQRNNGARSLEYARVLNRYIARLIALDRNTRALAVYRNEIARNSDDPGLYERLAGFLEQNELDREIEEVYRRALRRFPDRSWYHKLARWYLRKERHSAFEQLSREVTDLFSGSELEGYFQDVVVAGSASHNNLYLQLNLYAHKRFPHNLTFVHNLLRAYRWRDTRNLAAWEALLRKYWFFDGSLRARFFAHLSATGRLNTELEAIRQANPAAGNGQWQQLARANPGATQFLAEGEAWQSHFADAAPLMREMANLFPADAEIGRRASDLHRSLAPFEPSYTEVAASIEENLHQANPADRATLARVGEIHADREDFPRARPYWDRIAQLEPGKRDGYLESATVFWDYYHFDDALRMIGEGRKKFGDPALFAYEAGAIYENERNFPRAVEEYTRGALTGSASSARSRLLTLAKRRTLQDAILQATAHAVAGPNPPLTAVQLRLDVLETLERRKELGEFLQSLAEHTTSLELMAQIDPIANRHGLEKVRETLLTRRIDLTTDPVARIRLWLSLASFHERKKNAEAARAIIDDLYAANPLLQGIVRATVDFHWRNKRPGEAVAVLMQTAAKAYPALQKRFLFEAAGKSSQSARFEAAREILRGLLENDPYNTRYLTAMAETYARAGDDAGLRDFYRERIEAVNQTDWPRKTKRDHIASYRRSMIPALVRLREHAEVIDQYIEIINHSPEDATLLAQAAGYADKHDLEQRLTAYYRKTAGDSPRDYRWPMVLARLQTRFENYEQAIAAYDRSLEISPDRTDLHEARGRLEERLLRFDDAVQTYSKLYELAYNNPRWMEKVAELHARRSRTGDAVAALRKALIEGRPEAPENYFAVAQRLEQWNLLPQARTFADEGILRIKTDANRAGRLPSGLQLYARVLTRSRDHETAYRQLLTAWRAARRTNPRIQINQMAQPVRAMGGTVKTYFTPEEKLALVGFLLKERAGLGTEEIEGILLPLTETAGLAALEARWRFERIMAAPNSREARGHYRRLVELQKNRMQFNELGKQMEAYWRVHANASNRHSILREAASSYRSAGNADAEYRVLSQLAQIAGPGNMGSYEMERYLELMVEREPQRLLELAGRGYNRAVEFAIEYGGHTLAQQAVTARGRNRPLVWSRLYAGLTGLYYAHPMAAINNAFKAGLGVAPIGNRVGVEPDRDRQLAGDLWFYFGSRYGEFLDATGRKGGEDYLPAELEGRPANVAGYLSLASYYAEKGDVKRALAEYDHALELDSLQAGAHDQAARLLWEKGRRREATARWKAAITTLYRAMNRSTVPETFWPNLQAMLEQIGERKLLPALRPDVNKLLVTYVRRNGTYRVEPVLRGALAASGDPAKGVPWIVELSREAPNRVEFLSTLVAAEWIPGAHRESLFQTLLSAAASRVEESQGTARNVARNALEKWRLAWAVYLLENDQVERAQAAFAALTKEARSRLSNEAVPFELRLAARANNLAALMENYRRDPAKASRHDLLVVGATALRKDGFESGARRVLVFVYTRALENRRLTASNFLGLAEIRLEENNLPQALALLRRMVLVAGAPFENQQAAAALLLKTNHPNEAAEFLAERVRAVPWDNAARLRLAETRLRSRHTEAVALLGELAGSANATYPVRTQAALELRRAKAGGVRAGSAELDWIAGGGSPGSAIVRKPFHFQARLQAVKQLKDADQRIDLMFEALAMAPGESAAYYQLHRAAIDAKRHSLAVVSLEPILRNNRYDSLWRRLTRSADLQQRAFRDVTSYTGLLRSQTTWTEAERNATAHGLAAAYETLGYPGPAALFLKVALELEPQSRVRGSLTSRLKRMEAEVERRRQNALRRPTVTSDLNQPRVVRPRLPAPPANNRAGGSR